MINLIYQVMKVYDRYRAPARVCYAEFKNRLVALQEVTKLNLNGVASDGRINYTGELVVRVSWK